MGRFKEFWSQWVFDRAYWPVGWKNHPHDAFKGLARLACALLGSIVPVGLTFLNSGLPAQLDAGTAKVGVEFAVWVAVILVLWLIAVWVAARSEEKSLLKYVVNGTAGSGNLALAAHLIQTLK